MKFLPLFQSFCLLIQLDLIMRFRSLESIHSMVRRQAVISKTRMTPDEICQAISLACALYTKPVLCLQRSAVAVLLLRRYGWKSEMVIGAQLLPFRSHAWVEVDGRVINDKPYMRDIYKVLDRF
jgi:Transglutaminase-like superfamily